MEKIKIDVNRDITPINNLDDFELVVRKMERFLEDSMLAIEDARDKNGLVIAMPGAGQALISGFSSSINSYRDILEKVYSGDCSVRAGLKVYANNS